MAIEVAIIAKMLRSIIKVLKDFLIYGCFGRKNSLIEDHHYEAKRALLHRFTRMEAEYRYYFSLFEKSFELMEDKSERPDGIPISVLLNQSPERK